jgi:hypothetical protein
MHLQLVVLHVEQLTSKRTVTVLYSYREQSTLMADTGTQKSPVSADEAERGSVG